MALQRNRPFGSANFLVDFGDGIADSVAGGFSEVVFPDFAIAPPDDAATAPPGHLILKRGFMGSLDLYQWWNKARHGRAPKKKTLHVRLLDDDHETVVAIWRFRGVRPVRLSYSPLRATESGFVVETIEIAFERMEML
jgi:T4-like virus tail tube protein gp19